MLGPLHSVLLGFRSVNLKGLKNTHSFLGIRLNASPHDKRSTEAAGRNSKSVAEPTLNWQFGISFGASAIWLSLMSTPIT